MDRKPEVWETDAPGAFLAVGEVAVWALGDQRFRSESGGDSREVEGFQEARQLAHDLAGV